MRGSLDVPCLPVPTFPTIEQALVEALSLTELQVCLIHLLPLIGVLSRLVL